MNITGRDIQLLHYLHAVKVATYQQIHRDLYPEYQPRSVCNRIVKLERSGLVGGTQNRLHSCGERIISLSKKGFQKFVEKGNESRCEFKSEVVNHDLRLVDIRYTLMNLENCSSYYTENQIQTWGHHEYGNEILRFVRLNSDAIAKISFAKGDLWAVIEYEDAEKAAQRYDPIVRKYYLSEDVAIVLYICKSENTVRKICDIEKSIFPGDQPKFFYQTINNLGGNDDVSFYNCNNYVLRFATRKPDEQAMNS